MSVSRSNELGGVAGVIGGFAPLDSGLLVPVAYIPASAFIKTLLDDADAATARATLGVTAALLALTVYAPASQTVLSTTSATLADMDATNAAVTFAAPASGNVLVRVSGYADNTVGEAFVGLRESTTNVPTSVTRVARDLASDDFAQYLSVPMYVTGLAGGSHTLKPSFAVTGGTFRFIVQDGSVATTKWGPLIIEVWAAP